MAHRYECSHDADVCFNSSRRLQNSTKHSNSLHCESVSFLSFLRYYQHMAFVAQCGGEDIDFATILQLQSLAQFRYGEGEVAGSDVRLGDSRQMTLQLLLLKEDTAMMRKLLPGKTAIGSRLTKRWLFLESILAS